MSESQALIQVVNGELVQGTQYQIALADLAERVQLISHVDDAHSYAEAVELISKAKDYAKAIEAHAEPERIRLQGELSELRAQRDKMATAFTDVTKPLFTMAMQWKESERKAAQLEQDTLNKKRNGQEPVRVAPNIPTVPGARAHVNYSAVVVDEDKLISAYIASRGDKRKYLRQFVKVDIQALNTEARRVKSAKTLESMIPGIVGREEDRI